MADDDQRLLEEAKQSREENQQVREEAGRGARRRARRGAAAAGRTDGPDGEPWAKTSSGDADEITDDELGTARMAAPRGCARAAKGNGL